MPKVELNTETLLRRTGVLTHYITDTVTARSVTRRTARCIERTSRPTCYVPYVYRMSSIVTFSRLKQNPYANWLIFFFSALLYEKCVK